MRSINELQLAHQLADTADGISLRHFSAGAVPTTIKPDGSPVTVADHEVEQAIRSLLNDARPHDTFLGEESGAYGASARRWVIDPIDGTSNFAAGDPCWSTLIAADDGGEVFTGIVSAPAMQRRWWATRASGAWTGTCLDGRLGPGEALAVTSTATLDQAMVAIWPPTSQLTPQHQAAGARVVAACAKGGSLSDWDGVCHGALLVAAGVVDVFLHLKAGPWDIAAVVPIVEEAGGRFSDLDGDRGISTGAALFTNGRVHDEVLELVRADRG
ncbi:inositol monophosphatase family protein [Kitasatospora sp. NPDC058162]|uniref:inositol monophosphatase family protein n=1 Tax=Kitasatospora sp. NPDC058162 TaxID=3346362 RepID=UPI0036DD15B3